MSAPMILSRIEKGAREEQTPLRQTFLRYYGNPRLDIKQTLTAAGNHWSLTPRYSIALPFFSNAIE